MAELSPIKSRRIANSMDKLQKATSEGRFRIKSFRVKTVENDKINLDRDFQADLIKLGYSKDFLNSLYVLKSEQSQLKISPSKYLAFIRSLHQKLMNCNALQVASLNFQKSSLQAFLKQFTRVNQKVITLDLSHCVSLAAQEQTTNQAESLLINSIFNNPIIVRVALRNMNLKQEDLSSVLIKTVESERIFSLDIGNQGSQTMNRISDNLEILQEFFKRNRTTSIVSMENLSIKKNGVQQIQKGLTANTHNPLKILSLKNNAITEQASLYISLMAKSGLLTLDISQNPLGKNFYLSLPSWRASTIRNLDVSMTKMDSEALIYLLNRLQENKSLQILKLDKNDFSNNWFNQMKEVMEINTSIQNMSMVDCNIKRMNEAFKGLYHNRYLRKLNISANQFDQGTEELCQLIKLNKNLADLRLRFCGFKPNHFVSIFKALAHNNTITSLDLSQNQFGEEGAKAASKCLNESDGLSWLWLQKVQISMRSKKQIEDKVRSNRENKKNNELKQLKKQNINVKEQDQYTWDDVDKLDQRVKKNGNNIRIMENGVAALEKKFDQRRRIHQEIMYQYQERQKVLKTQIQKLQTQMKEIQREEATVVRQFDLRMRNAQQAAKKEEEAIGRLEELIRSEHEKNQIRQNQLEDQLEDVKYKMKKEVKKKNTVVKSGFDTSTALNSKRKSYNLL